MYTAESTGASMERTKMPNLRHGTCKNLALYIRDCVSMCLSDETLKAVGPFYLKPGTHLYS